MPRDISIIDLNDERIKRMAIAAIKNSKGLYWWDFRRCQRQRSLAINSYLWAVVYPIIRECLESVWGEKLTLEETHEFCKARFLSRPVVNRKTGESMGVVVGSTAAPQTPGFWDYLDDLFKFAAEYFGRDIPMPRNMTLGTGSELVIVTNGTPYDDARMLPAPEMGAGS